MFCSLSQFTNWVTKVQRAWHFFDSQRWQLLWIDTFQFFHVWIVSEIIRLMLSSFRFNFQIQNSNQLNIEQVTGEKLLSFTHLLDATAANWGLVGATWSRETTRRVEWRGPKKSRLQSRSRNEEFAPSAESRRLWALWRRREDATGKMGISRGDAKIYVDDNRSRVC